MSAIRAPDGLRCWPGQSLAQGAAGAALLHIERAHLGAGSWQTAHSWVTEATRDEISATDDTGLFFGALRSRTFSTRQGLTGPPATGRP